MNITYLHLLLLIKKRKTNAAVILSWALIYASEVSNKLLSSSPIKKLHCVSKYITWTAYLQGERQLLWNSPSG